VGPSSWQRPICIHSEGLSPNSIHILCAHVVTVVVYVSFFVSLTSKAMISPTSEMVQIRIQQRSRLAMFNCYMYILWDSRLETYPSDCTYGCNGTHFFR
jgi:hypothetical protein